MKSVSSLLLLSLNLCAAAVGPPVHVVHQSTVSVNGSNGTMGCTSLPLSVTERNTTCGSPGNGAISYLIDGVSPDIDTNTSNWASQIVTVRRSEGTADIVFPHVLLTFGFDTAVSLTGIEMDLFNCPDWNIGAPSITVYLNPEYNLVATTSMLNSLPFVIAGDNSPQSSCDSLSTVTFSGGTYLPGSYHTVYILVDLPPPSFIQWVHVGEVRFLDSSGIPLNFSTLLSSSSTSRAEKIIVTKTSHKELSIIATSSAAEIVPTSVPGDRENDCTCSEESSGSAVIAVSAVSLLLILTLTTVILTQCLLIIRMRRSRNKTETYAEATNPTTKTTDVPVSPNEAYALTKITSPREEVTYEVVK